MEEGDPVEVLYGGEKRSGVLAGGYSKISKSWMVDFGDGDVFAILAKNIFPIEEEPVEEKPEPKQNNTVAMIALGGVALYLFSKYQ